MNNKQKKCPCGRIITDLKNKTGLCPRCQKKANAAAAGVGGVGILYGIKKFGPKVLKSVMDIAKR